MRNQKVIATGSIARITENEAAFKQIKLIQELYDLFEDKCEDSIAQKELNSKIKDSNTYSSKIGTYVQEMKKFELYLKQLFKEIKKKTKLPENLSTFLMNKVLFVNIFLF